MWFCETSRTRTECLIEDSALHNGLDLVPGRRVPVMAHSSARIWIRDRTWRIPLRGFGSGIETKTWDDKPDSELKSSHQHSCPFKGEGPRQAIRSDRNSQLLFEDLSLRTCYLRTCYEHLRCDKRGLTSITRGGENRWISRFAIKPT
jgi:hypothetical protein